MSLDLPPWCKAPTPDTSSCLLVCFLLHAIQFISPSYWLLLHGPPPSRLVDRPFPIVPVASLCQHRWHHCSSCTPFVSGKPRTLSTDWSYMNYSLSLFTVVGVSCLLQSLLNEWASPAPEVVCAVYALSVILSFVWAFFVAGGRFPQLRRSASLDQPQQTANSILS